MCFFQHVRFAASGLHGGLLQALSKGFVVKSGMQKSVMSVLSEDVLFDV